MATGIDMEIKMKQFKDIEYTKEKDTGIVTIALNRPETKNALTFNTAWELSKALDMVQSDETATAIILIGKHDPHAADPQKEFFSSGGYLNPKTQRIGEPDQPLSKEVQSEQDPLDLAQKRFSLKLIEFDKPVITALNGLAVGGGFTMPLIGSDLIYASEHAWIQMPFVRMGIVPEFASSFILPSLLGLQKAKEILYFGKKITSRELYRLGLINGVVPHKKLLSHVKSQVLQLIPPLGPGLAVKMTKKVLHAPVIDSIRKTLDRENRFLGKAVLTEDFKEFVRAYSIKRLPNYKGC